MKVLFSIFVLVCFLASCGGTNGSDGNNGRDGSDGEAGQGEDGKPGVPGADGEPGLDGQPGDSGIDVSVMCVHDWVENPSRGTVLTYVASWFKDGRVLAGLVRQYYAGDYRYQYSSSVIWPSNSEYYEKGSIKDVGYNVDYVGDGKATFTRLSDKEEVEVNCEVN